MSADDTEATFNLYCPPPRPDRAAAAREVEALLRRVRHVHTKLVEPEYDMTDDDGVIRPRTAADLAALVVDAVLGQEET